MRVGRRVGQLVGGIDFAISINVRAARPGQACILVCDSPIVIDGVTRFKSRVLGILAKEISLRGAGDFRIGIVTLALPGINDGVGQGSSRGREVLRQSPWVQVFPLRWLSPPGGWGLARNPSK